MDSNSSNTSYVHSHILNAFHHFCSSKLRQ